MKMTDSSQKMFRFDILNGYIQRNNYKNYLEIGVFQGVCFRNIVCENKDGVDPGIQGKCHKGVNYPMDSDSFFDQNEKIYDVVFIDGLHHTEQVDKDIQNSLKFTQPNGVILLHDCNPPSLKYAMVPRQQTAWNGDVYKSVLKFQMENEEHTYFTINTDWGVGVILKNKYQGKRHDKEFYQNGIDDWDFFHKNRKELLNLIDVSEFKDLFSKGIL